MTIFRNKHGYMLNRCGCGKATLPHHDSCAVCEVNKEDKREHADKD